MMDAAFLDTDGVKRLWGEIEERISGSSEALEVDATLSKNGNTLGVTTPVRGIVSQAEFDALPEEERNTGLWIISDGDAMNACKYTYVPDSLKQRESSIANPCTGSVLLYNENDNVIIYANYNNGLYRSTDDAVSWEQVESFPSFSSVGGAYGNGVFIVTEYGLGRIARSTDNGDTWNIVYQYSETYDQYNTLRATVYGDGKFLTFKDGANLALLSEDYGETWEQIVLPEIGAWRYADFANGTFVVVDSSNMRGVLTSKDGRNWTRNILPESDTYTLVTHDDNGTFWVPTKKSSYISTTLLKSDDGYNWEIADIKLPVVSSLIVTGIAFHGSAILITHNSDPGLSLSGDRGQTWESVTAGGSGEEMLTKVKNYFVSADTKARVVRKIQMLYLQEEVQA